MTYPVRGVIVLGLVACLGFGLAAYVWGVAARLDGAIVALGQVRPEHGRRLIQHPDGGAVVAVLVREGQLVRSGDILVRLDASEPNARGAQIRAELLPLLAEAARLQAEAEDLPEVAFPPDMGLLGTAAAVAAESQRQLAIFQSGNDRLRQSRAALAEQQRRAAEQADGQRAQLAAIERQLALLDEDIATTALLVEKALMESPVLRGLRREAARLQGQAAEVRAAIAAAGAQIAEIDLSRLNLDSERRLRASEDLRLASTRIAALQEGLRDTERTIAERTLRAPVAGIVQGLAINGPGAVARPAETLLTLVPSGDRLTVLATVEVAQAKGMRVGQLAWMRIPAVAGRDAPMIEAEVVRVAADAALDERSGLLTFQVELQPLPSDDAAQAQLRVGAQAEVFIRTGAHAPLALLLDPVTHYFGRALRG